MARSKKSLRKIKLLIFLMLITIVMTIAATYAWFSTQRDVEISGMKLNVEVAESMQISLDGEKWAQSIQIANMRQFYGTYTGTGDSFAIYQAKKIADGGNTNYVPTELLPVSSAGEVQNGKLQFVQGTMSTNADGTTKLTGITACSETDLTNTAPIADRQSNNENHPYLVFDMYLRNVSAKTAGVDELKLNQLSTVSIQYDTSDQEGVGEAGTGLEYSARVGMIIYGNTISITAGDIDGGATIGEQIRALTPTGSEVAAIWEPNYKEHTQYVVNNNGRGITSTEQEVTTYGIKVATALATPNEIANVNSTTDANLVAVNTFKPTYTQVSTGTTTRTTITDTEGNNVGLAPNQISKVRVYIWLEGQDPDCVDLASTGDKLNVTLKLTKDQTNSTDENTYTGEAPSGGTETTQPGEKITASGVKVGDYGAYVTNYTSTNGANVNWRLYHSDGSNIYIIADDYIENQYAPNGKGGTAVNTDGVYNATYNFFPGDIVVGTDYAGTADISSTLKTKLLSKYTYTSTEYNAKATAYLMDTNQWSGFKDSSGYADYAIGGPTLELFAASYNTTHTDRAIETQVRDDGYGYGYIVKWNDEEYNADGNNYWIEGLDTDDSLYVITDTTKAFAYCLASPSAGDSGDVMLVLSDGYVVNSNYASGGLGALPLVSLKSNIQIEKQEDGTFLIVP